MLSQAMAQALECDTMHEWLTLPPQAGRVRASLFELGAVIQEQMNELGGWQLEIKMPRREFEAISRREGFPEYLLSI